jgi:hypothetical protein
VIGAAFNLKTTALRIRLFICVHLCPSVVKAK